MWKITSELQSPIMLGDSLITTSFSFFIADFNLFSCEFGNFVFKQLYCVILCYYELKSQLYSKTFMVPCENSKMVSFASSVIKNIVVFLALSKLAVKLIC